MIRPFRSPKITLFALGLAFICLLGFVALEWPPIRLAHRMMGVARRELRLDWMDADRGAPAGTKYQTFFSRTIQREVSYLIYLPPGYAAAPQHRYPVIYWLHGRGGTQREGAGVFVPALDAAIRSGKIPATIAVLLNGMYSSRWLDSPDGKLPMESVIMRDLIPHIDSTYRTIPDRGARAVEGFSMGGFGAAHLGFKYPEVFGTVSMFSAALFDESSDEDFLEATSPWRLVFKNAAVIRGRTLIRMIVGDQDPMLELNRKFDLLLASLNIPHDYIVVARLGHNEARIYKYLGDSAFLFYRRAWGEGSIAGRLVPPEGDDLERAPRGP
jgi:enterochelin esterase-like enzyme